MRWSVRIRQGAPINSSKKPSRNGWAFCVLGASVRLLAVVVALVLRTDELHLRILFLLSSNRSIDPSVIGFRCQRRDEHRILTFSMHAAGEMVHEVDPI